MLKKLKTLVTVGESVPNPIKFYLLSQIMKENFLGKLARKLIEFGIMDDTLSLKIFSDGPVMKINFLDEWNYNEFYINALWLVVKKLKPGTKDWKICYCKDDNSIIITNIQLNKKYVMDFNVAKLAAYLILVKNNWEVKRVNDEFSLVDIKYAKFYIRNQLPAFLSDLIELNSIYAERAYYFDCSSTQPLIIDIGGYIGDTAVWFAKKYNARVWVYEPAPQLYDICLRNIELNKVADRVFVFPEGLWSEPSENTFVHKRGTPTHAFAVSPEKMNDKLLDENNASKEFLTSKFKFITLEQMVSRCGGTEIELIKVDCEGAEYASIPKTPPHILRKSKTYIVDFHGGDPDLLINAFREAGFTVKIKNLYLYRGQKYGIIEATRAK